MFKLLLSFLFLNLSYGWQETFEYANGINLSPFVSKSGDVSGPRGTWIPVLQVSIGGLIKEKQNYCLFFKMPGGSHKGSLIFQKSSDENCEWDPLKKQIMSSDEVEFLQIFKDEKSLEIKYSRQNRLQSHRMNLYNIQGPVKGVLLVPRGKNLAHSSKREELKLCGERLNPACIKRKKQSLNSLCENLEEYYFCSPGTILKCKDGKAYCL